MVSIGLLCLLGIQNLVGVSAAFESRDVGQFTRTAQFSSGIGAILATLLWFGLAYAQWSRRGSWGCGIGIFALVVLATQSALTYLAMSRGAIPVDARTLTRFIIFSVVPAWLAGFALHASMIDAELQLKMSGHRADKPHHGANAEDLEENRQQRAHFAERQR